jgi:hypothetical protein
LAGPTHVDDDRVITAGILRQNAQTSLKGASAICHRSDGAVSTFPVGTLILHSRITARNSVNAAARPYAVPVKLKALLSAVAHAIPEFI